MSYLNKINDVYKLLGEGKAMDAFEKYYHEDVIMIEGNSEKHEGKDTNRKREPEFFGSIEEMHGAGVDTIVANEEEGITMAET
tara:strand:- start:7451 stop:7699 length:249 start_codon:yes stop_codon:yes gene_type:complete